MQVPNPKDYTAKWVGSGGGARLASRNLWIYDRITERKRFSVTTAAGAKIQPYFDVPLPDDPNLYVFTVIGEVILDGRIRCWVTRATVEDLRNVLGAIDSKTIERAVQEHIGNLPVAEAGPPVQDPAEPIEVSAETYELLTSRLPGVNDDHCFQLLIRALKKQS
jgi:hypothetical protein